ncbi:hypothetical protein M758_1G009500 [Ceratodon purpureus]|nr:hypothetical protein M758_1G009500 [Ceratodon purpureus]
MIMCWKGKLLCSVVLGRLSWFTSSVRFPIFLLSDSQTMLEGFGVVPLSIDGITQAVWSTPDGQHMPL